MTHDTDPPITVAICSNRPSGLADAVTRALPLLSAQDHLLVVADMPAGQLPLLPAVASPPRCRLRVICNAANLGLAYSRNRAMKEAPTRHVVFLDDDIVATAYTLEWMRDALAGGAHLVGTRITAHFQGRRRPWFLSTGQLHYLGSHAPSHPASIWGGSFGIDIDHARLLGIGFNERLGRIGSTLASAEDTTFVRQMTAHGATTAVLHNTEVLHLIPAYRLRLTYLLRRAYWQGRSEVRRRDGQRGIAKEWHRNRSGDRSRPLRLLLTLLYTGSVLLGACTEALAGLGRVRREERVG